MLVHVVNSANRSYYSEYIEDMFRLRKEVFFDQLGWKDLKIIDGLEKDEMDEVEGVEYLLTLAANGELIGCCRCNPTTSDYLLGGPLKNYVQRPFEPGHDVWEFTRLAPTRRSSFEQKLEAHAYLSAGIMEWALTKGIKRLIGVCEQNLIALSARLGWQIKLLGMPIEYEPGREAVAMEYKVDYEALASTRKFYNTKNSVLYIAPPKMTNQIITLEEVWMLDAVNQIFLETPDPSIFHLASNNSL